MTDIFRVDPPHRKLEPVPRLGKSGKYLTVPENANLQQVCQMCGQTVFECLPLGPGYISICEPCSEKDPGGTEHRFRTPRPPSGDEAA